MAGNVILHKDCCTPQSAAPSAASASLFMEVQLFVLKSFLWNYKLHLSSLCQPAVWAVSSNTQAVVSQLMLGGAGATTGHPSPPRLPLPSHSLCSPLAVHTGREGSWSGHWVGKVFWATSCPLASRAAWYSWVNLHVSAKSWSPSLHSMSFFPIPALPTPCINAGTHWAPSWGISVYWPGKK